MGIIYGYGTTATEVTTMLNGSLTTNTTDRITSLKFSVDPATDIGDAATLGSLYAIAIVEKDDKFNGRNTFFSAVGSEFAHFNVEIAAAFDSNYGVSEIALVAIGSIENGSLLSLEAIGVTTGEPGNSGIITYNETSVATTMGSVAGSINDNPDVSITTADWAVLGSTQGGADVNTLEQVYAIAFTTTKP